MLSNETYKGVGTFCLTKRFFSLSAGVSVQIDLSPNSTAFERNVRGPRPEKSINI